MVLASCNVVVHGQEPSPAHPIDPRDCVMVRYPLLDSSFRSSIQINPQGNRVAYLVKSPNLQTNQNDIELYVRRLPVISSEKIAPILTGTNVSSLQWLGDGRRVAVLMKPGNRTVVVIIDSETGQYEVAARAESDITEFSLDRQGDRIVFAVEDVAESGLQHDAKEAAHGYRIPFPLPASPLPQRTLYLASKAGTNKWSSPTQIHIVSPFTQKRASRIRYQQSLLLSLSPDGRNLLIRSMEDPNHTPAAWLAAPYVKSLLAGGYPAVPVMLRYEIDKDRTTIPFATPWEHGLPLWSPDSKAFVLMAQSPVTATDKPGEHLYWVDPVRNGYDIVYSERVVSPGEQPLFWRSDGRLFLHTATDTITALSREQDDWKTVATLRIPKNEGIGVFPVLATDGVHVVGEEEGVVRTPAMFSFDPATNRMEVFHELNLQLSQRILATTKEIHWTTTSGNVVEGRLFLPSDYHADRAYPLVIQTKPGWNGFACDTGISHFPSFAPQPLASNGILYLERTYPENFAPGEELKFYPKGYPGGVAEAAYELGVWDGAIGALSKQGSVDANRVGIIGFSRSGWYTEFSLVHSRYHYRAATVTDNVQYSIGTYWLLHTDAVLRGFETMYEGPPSGASLKNWIDFSISFNLEKNQDAITYGSLGAWHGL